jgi:hypothetical protein
MMTRQIHGVTSLGFAAIAVLIAAIAIFQTSWLLGLLYLGICIAAARTILYAFCAKCSCKANCVHILPGKAALSITRQPGPYSPTELGAVVLALALLMGLPQIWLWQYTGLLIAFWVLNAVAFVQIRAVACRACDNSHCPLRIKIEGIT